MVYKPVRSCADLVEVAIEIRLVVPPKSNRKKTLGHDQELYKGRDVVERNFHKIKQFQRAYARYDKLDET